MNPDRSWMYQRMRNGKLIPSFVEGVEAFIAFTHAHPDCVKGGLIKCPCSLKKCSNRSWKDPKIVVEHLKKNGFVSKYHVCKPVR